MKLFEERELRLAGENDEDMLFLKSLHPYMKEARDKLNLRLQMMTVVKDFLNGEKLFDLNINER